MKEYIIKIGKPTHLLKKNRETACGRVGVEFAAYDPRDVDCISCKATMLYKSMMKSTWRETK